MRTLFRLLLLVVVLLMPIGMTPASAGARHDPTMARMPVGHCPDQGSHRDMKGGIAECTMACAAALPAMDALVGERLLIACDPIGPATADRLHGIHPETATPPPRRS